MLILCVGFVLKLPIWGQPEEDQIFDDTDFWDIPEDGFPAEHPERFGAIHAANHERSLENGRDYHPSHLSSKQIVIAQ